MTQNSRKILTLCFVYQRPYILLGLKKRGFGAGRWNGFGGKVQEGEKIEEAACREMHEEAGVEIAAELKKRGVLHFIFEGDPEELEVHVFSTEEVTGDPKETEEMKPFRFHFEEIPYDTMWPDDRMWLPLFLAGKNFEGSFFFQGMDTIVHYELHETEKI